MSTQSIDIDSKPEIHIELPARVVLVDLKPHLLPGEGTEGRWLASLARFVGDVTLTLSRKKRTRSTEANAYLWGVVYEDILQGLRAIAQDAGERCPFADRDELHDAMKYLRLGVEVLNVNGVTIERPHPTRSMDSKEFTAYVDWLKKMAAERWRIYVREPGEGPL